MGTDAFKGFARAACAADEVARAMASLAPSLTTDQALRGYVGDCCRYCGYVYATVQDLDERDVVWAHDRDTDPPITGKGQSLACLACLAAAKGETDGD